MNARKALKAGFGWQIGDCKKARIGLDRWGFEGLDGNSLKDPSSGSRERVVCELWESNNRAWDRDLVQELYSDFLGDQICALPLIQDGLSDRTIGSGEEMTIHALKEYLKACAVLALSGIDRCLLDNEYERCIDWLEEATRLLDKKAFKDLISILWNVWNNRNNAIFRGKDEDARIVWDRAKALGDDFRIHNFTNALIIPMNPSEPSIFEDITTFGYLIKEIIGMLEFFTEIKINLIGHTSNKVADRLCNLALNKKCTLSFDMEYPCDIHELVMLDSC
ncbi:hypothetical protein Gotur_028046 [Gossypium turneri]